MISDLLTLRKELISASDAQDVAQKQARLTQQVRVEIAALFDDPNYPERRRSFGVIRKRLGIFEENDPALKTILFELGARVHRGEGEEALWELKDPNQPAPSVRPARPLRIRLALAALVVAVVLVALNAVLLVLADTSLIAFARGLMPATETLQSCLTDANGIMTEILRCNQTHGS